MPTRALVAAAVFLLPLGCATARTPGAATTNGYGRVTTPDANCAQLASIADDWQDLLGLGDWRIVLYCHDRGDVPDRAVGESRVAVLDRVAAVWIRPGLPDPEGAIVHELMHLFTAMICSSEDDSVREPPLRALARALRR